MNKLLTWAIKRFGQKIKEFSFRDYWNNKIILPKFKQMNYETHKKFISDIQFGKKNCKDYLDIVSEIIYDKKFNNFINENFKLAKLNCQFPIDVYSWPITLYYLVRKLKPKIIVETGVWYGISTSYILASLNTNNYGKLYSIDLPAYFEKGGYYDENPYLKKEDRIAKLPKAKEPGFIVPKYLYQRWKLIIGSSKDELPKLLKKLKSIDFFLHDSLHSYENMIFEFNLAYKYLKKNSLIFSDNIDWNNAFNDFAKKTESKHYKYLAYYETPRLYNNFGAIKK